MSVAGSDVGRQSLTDPSEKQGGAVSDLALYAHHVWAQTRQAELVSIIV